MRNTIFISYCQKDKERVTLFASMLANNGFDIWMDVKNISLGESIVSSIATGLNEASIYMLFISKNSNKSSWVNEELNIALSMSINNKTLKIVPVLLDDCEIPLVLTGRKYLDARNSIQTALLQLNEELQKNSLNKSYHISLQKKPVLIGVVFGLSKDTDISYGPLCDVFTKDDLIKNRDRIKKMLRKCANGILMNFVPLSEFDLSSPVPKYKNGIYDESLEIIPGDIASSIGEKIIANATIFDPNINKLKDLIKNKLEELCVTSLTYVFSIPTCEEDFNKKCMQKIQDNYTIISYDFEEGVTIKIDDLFIDIKCHTEQIQIKIHSKYDFLFAKNATNFSPEDFIEWLTNDM